MTKAREQQIHLSETSYYHCVARCVRRAFLCGKDSASGQDFSHRKQWIVDKIKELSGIYALDVCAYAVMSNHYHIVLHIDAETAESWSEEVVIERWKKLFKGNMLIERFLRGEIKSKAELTVVDEIIATWRERLMDISWFMRCLNESIAREANKEDNCKGRFWEGRFKSQALLDETALLTCMMYVDLNPIRAGINNTLEGSEFTSIQERLFAFAQQRKSRQSKNMQQEAVDETTIELLSFKGGASLKTDSQKGLPFSLQDYFELIDWTGRVIRDDKKGAIPSHVLPILQKLGVNEVGWADNVNHFGRRFYHVVGAVDAMQQYSDKIGQWWMQGMGCSRRLYC